MDETKAKSIFWVRLADGKTKRLNTIPSLAASVVPTVLRSSKLILGDGLHEQSGHTHTRGGQKNADSSWKTGLLKEKPGLLVESKELFPMKNHWSQC